MMPENAESIMLACVTLHNFLKLNSLSASLYFPPTFADWEDASTITQPRIWKNELQTALSSVKPSANQHYYGRQATATRKELKF